MPGRRVGIVTRHLHEASGVGTYSRELIAALPGAGVEPVVFSPRPPRLGEVAEGVEVISARGRGKALEMLWTMGRAAPLARRAGIDLLHYLWPIGSLRPGPPYVVTVHDALNFSLPAYRLSPVAERLLRRSVERARMVLTPSEHALNEITFYYQVPEERVAVTPLGAPDVETRPDGIGGDWWLFLGGIERRKNLRGVIEAWNSLAEPRAPLRVAGTLAPSQRHEDRGELERMAAPGLEMLGFVSEDELDALYRGAIALVVPSHAEGFGLPLVEAMARGVPVIASAGGAMEEVAGDGALLVAPDPGAIADGMRRVASDSELRARLRENGLRRARYLQWRRTAKTTAASYERALADRE